MRQLVGATTIGDCTENERQIPGNGNAEQRTTNGMLVFRAIDSRVMFVGANQTWINRDGQVVTRPNNQRLEWEGDRQLIEQLRNGGFIVYFRHGATDNTQQDSDPNNLANCATQRNLNQAGRDQGRQIGEALRTLNISAGTLRSSEYCRAKEYAQLLFGRDAQIEPSIVLPDPLPQATQQQNTEAFRRLLAQAPPANSNVVYVSHSPNIRQAMNVDLPVEGTAAIIRVEGGNPQLVARILPTEWAPLAQALANR
jgi:phosphohistidine phosphatase SixA